MTAGLLTVAACVLLALAFGGWRAYADGRFRRWGAARRAEPAAPREAEEPLVPAERLGERATLLQFSSAFCAPCRATRQVLSEVADVVPGVAHVELDAEHHLGLVRRVGVRRTPTTLVLDGAGREVTRAAGAPRREQVLAALSRLPG
jgi:thiol-disulfide isomerase/thioredoxin